MQIKKGTSRTSFIIGKLVFKFPRIIFLWRMVQYAWQYRSLNNVNSRMQFLLFMRGIIANITEFASYIYKPSPYKAQVFFSLGFVIIQKNIVGDNITWQELQSVWIQFSEEAKFQQQLTDLHSWDQGNFRKTKKGVICVDFGDTFLSGANSFSDFLNEWDDELTRLLIKAPA